MATRSRQLVILCGFIVLGACQDLEEKKVHHAPPNILFAISDDQSYPHTSFAGCSFIHTPSFDRIAKSGTAFANAFVAAPQCSPSRAAILTGLNIWQLEEAGTHSSYFPRKFPVFTDRLEEAGYELGYTGKPWGPGNWKDAGWERNPVGHEFNDHVFDSVPYSGINKRDYATNFEAFYKQKQSDEPFFFWYGAHEPHRGFEQDSWKKAGKNLASADVPDFLPDDTIVRGDLLDYAVEIEWFDAQLGKMLDFLEMQGELENTIVIVTADNGMAFPAAKANLYEYGTHVPLAIAGPGILSNQIHKDPVGLIDLAPTLLDLTDCSSLDDISGISMVDLLSSNNSPRGKSMVTTGRERHTHARADNLGYPARALRDDRYLYILNLAPDRWPAGDPPIELVDEETDVGDYKYMAGGYHDIDNCPSKSLLLEDARHKDYFELAVSKRPGKELFDVESDPYCTRNLASDPQFFAILTQMDSTLMGLLEQQEDPRVIDGGRVFDSYPRFARMRLFPGFRERGKYNPAFTIH